MDLLKELLKIKTTVEHVLGTRLEDEDFADGREEIAHIFLHESCHAAVTRCVPWIHALEDGEHTAVDELMARFLEKDIGESLGMPIHSTVEWITELWRYPVNITREGYHDLQGLWDEYFFPKKDLTGMATATLVFLRYGELIYHLLSMADWEEAQRDGVYQPAGLTEDGFIHCSTITQVIDVANHYYGGHPDLVLLGIAVDRVGAVIRYEDLLGEGKRFPHIYGALNLDAVVSVARMTKDSEGQFVLPTGSAALSL